MASPPFNKKKYFQADFDINVMSRRQVQLDMYLEDNH